MDRCSDTVVQHYGTSKVLVYLAVTTTSVKILNSILVRFQHSVETVLLIQKKKKLKPFQSCVIQTHSIDNLTELLKFCRISLCLNFRSSRRNQNKNKKQVLIDTKNNWSTFPQQLPKSVGISIRNLFFFKVP